MTGFMVGLEFRRSKAASEESGEKGDSLVHSAVKSFEAGRFQQLLTDFYDSARGALRTEALAYVIAALAFIGRADEAWSLFSDEADSLRPDDLAFVRFFLAVSSTREGDGRRKARRLFRLNSVLSRGGSVRQKFFKYQGLAFQRYYEGQLRSCHELAKQALRYSIQEHYIFGRILAIDLLGHTQVQLGDTDRGLENLRLAGGLAAKLDNEGIASAISTSRILYKAQYGLAPGQIVALLKERLEHLKTQDTYTRANLLLELARQQTLRGLWAHAEDSLSQAARVVYTFNNPRKEIVLNLRLAQIQFLRGEDTQALSFVRSARRCLHGMRDEALLLQVLGMELKVMKTLDYSDDVRADIERQLIRHTKSYPGALNRRIISRNKAQRENLTIQPQRGGSDPIADLKDQTQRGEGEEPVFRLGYLSLLLDLNHVRRGERAIVFDWQPDSVTVFDRKGIAHFDIGKTRLNRKILFVLGQGEQTKEQLVQRVWQYEYDPLRHDSMIYASIQSCRKMLKSFADWLETTDAGYRLKPGVRIVQASQAALRHEATLRLENRGASGQASLSEAWIERQLNHRQVEILKDLGEGEYIDTRSWAGRFGISEITANRDLRELVHKNFLIRVGRARATRYTKPVGV